MQQCNPVLQLMCHSSYKSVYMQYRSECCKSCPIICLPRLGPHVKLNLIKQEIPTLLVLRDISRPGLNSSVLYSIFYGFVYNAPALLIYRIVLGISVWVFCGLLSQGLKSHGTVRCLGFLVLATVVLFPRASKHVRFSLALRAQMEYSIVLKYLYCFWLGPRDSSCKIKSCY